MAFIHGHQCDGCGTIEKVSLDAKPDDLPAGWIKVILPGTSRDKEQDRQRALCSGSCLALFAMERQEAEEAA